MPLEPAGDPRVAVLRLFAAVERRRWFVRFAFCLALGVAAGALVTAAAYLTGWNGAAAVRIAAIVLITAAAMGLSLKRWSSRGTGEAIERTCPSCRNLVITAEELIRHPDRASPAITARVLSETVRAVGDLRAREVVPVGRAFMALAFALAAGLLTSPRGTAAIQDVLTTASGSVGGRSDTLATIEVKVEPPAYSGRPAVTLTDPDRIDALEGSHVRFELPGGWHVRFGNAEPATELVARDSGYFAVEESGGGGRRLIPLNVSRDRAPVVRIDAPAKDLLLSDGRRTIPVALSATDDFGLQTLELRYTRVSGTGEQFEFVEGALPVTVQRTSARDWRAKATLALASLHLGPGDSLVYRAVARDRRAGDAGLAASDTYFVEIAGPGQVALEGVDMPSELERHALSQQMIVLKLERLRARQSAMVREALVEEAASIAAEQRAVRANFVFLLGGHVEDEEEEAEQSHEIQEGRLENTARKDINAAILQMTRVEQGLTAVNTAAALPPARAAVEALQRAFGRSRYLLRALAVHSRLDPSRRLTGDLAGAADWRRVVSDPAEREGEAARRLLDQLVQVAETARNGFAVEPARLHELAERALAIDPSSELWRAVARRLLDGGEAGALQQVIAQVSPEALRGTLPRTRLSEADSALVRAFKAERRP